MLPPSRRQAPSLAAPTSPVGSESLGGVIEAKVRANPARNRGCDRSGGRDAEPANPNGAGSMAPTTGMFQTPLQATGALAGLLPTAWRGGQSVEPADSGDDGEWEPLAGRSTCSNRTFFGRVLR